MILDPGGYLPPTPCAPRDYSPDRTRAIQQYVFRPVINCLTDKGHLQRKICPPKLARIEKHHVLNNLLLKRTDNLKAHIVRKDLSRHIYI